MLWYPLTFMIYIYIAIYICIATPNNPEICKTTTTVLRCSFLWRFPNMGTPKSSIWSDVPWKKHIQLLGYPPMTMEPTDPSWPAMVVQKLQEPVLKPNEQRRGSTKLWNLINPRFHSYSNMGFVSPFSSPTEIQNGGLIWFNRPETKNSHSLQYQTPSFYGPTYA